jgi:hypothetical protein
MSRFSAPIVNKVAALSSSGGKCENVRLLPFPPLAVLRTVVNRQEIKASGMARENPSSSKSRLSLEFRPRLSLTHLKIVLSSGERGASI